VLESDARTFKLWLASIAGLGLVWRCAYALASQDRDLPKDGKYFHVGANLLAEGKGFIDPIAFAFTGASIPGAIHPPAWTALLASVSVVGLDSTLEHQLFACLVGAGTIVLVGFTGRRIGGPRSGLVAATIAACYPGFWSYERSLLSETLVIASVAVTILCAYRYLEHPRLGRAIALGACCGALALQRAEQLLLVVLLLAPLVLLTRTVTLRQRMAWLAASTAVCALLVVPWVLYNNSRFQERVFIASNTGTTLSASNCLST
jgi:4-amino-4-deoxy-L-arabinose transferase-like glycosyltransferase